MSVVLSVCVSVPLVLSVYLVSVVVSSASVVVFFCVVFGIAPRHGDKYGSDGVVCEDAGRSLAKVLSVPPVLRSVFCRDGIRLAVDLVVHASLSPQLLTGSERLHPHYIANV